MKELWYTFKHRILPGAAAYLAKGLLHLLVKTCDVKISGLEAYKKVANEEKCILMFWHDRIALAPEILSSYTSELLYSALVSQSRDGEIIATIVNSYSIGSTIRVPHNARKAALDETIRELKKDEKVIIITPDGPRGPRYRIKRGLAYLAKVSDASIIPMSWSASKSWQLNTWDLMLIPKPFSTINVTFGNAIKLEKGKELPTKEEIVMLENHLESLR